MKIFGKRKAITKNTIVFIGNPGTILVMHIQVNQTDHIVIAITVNGVVNFLLDIEMNLIKGVIGFSDPQC